MKTKITVKQTEKGAILVNGQLMRTRQINGGMSNKVATYEIMKHILCLVDEDESLMFYPYVYDVLVSDKEMFGAEKLKLHTTWINGFSIYSIYGSNNVCYLPCPRWFEKLTGIAPPVTLWLKLLPA